MRRKLALIAILGILFAGAPHRVTEVAPSERREQRVRFLCELVSRPLEAAPEIRALAYENPEWQLFTYAFTTYALAQLVAASPERAAELQPAMRRAIATVDGPTLRSVFGASADDPRRDAHEQAIYYGHLNLMLGVYREATGDPALDARHTALTEALAAAVLASPTGNLASYPGRFWPADNSVVMASLAVSDRCHGTDHGAAIRRWLRWIEGEFLDPHGLMLSEIHPHTHVAVDGARGCSVAWTSVFAWHFAPAFARSQYAAMRATLGGALLGYPLFREYPGRHITGLGDIDSGPLILGYGVAASGLGYAAATAAGDQATARGIRRLVELFGLATEADGRRRYRVFSPLSDALILWGETAWILGVSARARGADG